jgi:hypothetical protein
VVSCYLSWPTFDLSLLLEPVFKACKNFKVIVIPLQP